MRRASVLRNARVRPPQRLRSREREFDALYVGTRAALLNQTKSSPRIDDVQAFVRFLDSGEFGLYFPQYRALPVVPALSSLSIPDDIVT